MSTQNSVARERFCDETGERYVRFRFPSVTPTCTRKHQTEKNEMTINRRGSKLAEIAKISTIDAIASTLGRYGLVVVIARIGALKFTNYAAHGIPPLVAHSPFMSWLYHIFPVDTFSALLGTLEFTAAVFLAIKPLSPKLSIVGSLLAILLFVSTVSFLFTTSGVSEPAGGGFPALSMLGQFPLKDIALLGLSLWTLADSIRAAGRTHSETISAIAYSPGEFDGHAE